jgi:hypothetical protein
MDGFSASWRRKKVENLSSKWPFSEKVRRCAQDFEKFEKFKNYQN